MFYLSSTGNRSHDDCQCVRFPPPLPGPSRRASGLVTARPGPPLVPSQRYGVVTFTSRFTATGHGAYFLPCVLATRVRTRFTESEKLDDSVAKGVIGYLFFASKHLEELFVTCQRMRVLYIYFSMVFSILFWIKMNS